MTDPMSSFPGRGREWQQRMGADGGHCSGEGVTERSSTRAFLAELTVFYMTPPFPLKTRQRGERKIHVKKPLNNSISLL